MKIRKQQDNFYSKKILSEFLNRVFFKHQIQKKIKKIQKIRNQLFLNLQQLDNYIVAYQNLSLEKRDEIEESISKSPEKRQIYKNIDEVVRCIGINPEMKELIVKKVEGKVISTDKENIDLEEELEVLYQFKVENLITKTIDKAYRL